MKNPWILFYKNVYFEFYPKIRFIDLWTDYLLSKKELLI
jgi:hypothetical protein